MRTGVWLLLITFAVGAAIAANYVLLGYGAQSEDPVRRLTPRLAAVMAGTGGAATRRRRLRRRTAVIATATTTDIAPGRG